jgi:hypothetical protein
LIGGDLTKIAFLGQIDKICAPKKSRACIFIVRYFRCRGTDCALFFCIPARCPSECRRGLRSTTAHADAKPPRSTRAYLFAFQPLHGPSLPITIESRDNAILTYSVDKFPAISAVAVTTADGREWFASRKDIRKIHEDKVYQAIQQKNPTAPGS